MAKSLFDSFNARPVPQADVGRNFIYNSSFEKLATNESCIAIGPRGSGKTTYFKMLTLDGLRGWYSTHQRNTLLSRLDFTAIYIPTDFSWFPDFRQPVNLSLPGEIEEILSYARFRNSLLRALIETLMSIRSDRICSEPQFKKFAQKMSSEQENKLCVRLADVWGLEPKFSGFDGIITSLNIRNREIQRLTTSAYYHPDKVTSRISEMEFLHDAITDDMRSFADIVDNFFQRKRKWAVCFDEVEIAPTSVKREIWKCLRSFDQRFVIKLSASPYDDELWKNQSANEAMPNNDYKEVWLLSQQSDAEIFDFSKKMFTRLCQDSKIPADQSDGLLGLSYYDDEFDQKISEEGSENRSGVQAGKNKLKKDRSSFYERKYRSLAGKDPSFSKYWANNKISPDNLGVLTANERAFVRKHISSMVIRDAYFSPTRSGTTPRLASKKSIDRFYSGETTIFKICEGNPRWLLVVLKPLLERYLRLENRSSVIPREMQVRALEEGVSSLLSILSTVAPRNGISGKQVSLLELIEMTGDFFFKQVLGPEYKAEPVLSFKVDKGLTPEILTVLGIAINQGAFSIESSSPRNPRSLKIEQISSLVNLRLRLSYYLAPRYRLPLNLGRSQNLSTIINAQKGESASERQIVMDLSGTQTEVKE